MTSLIMLPVTLSKLVLAMLGFQSAITIIVVKGFNFGSEKAGFAN
jgi:hypothetical protein